jgi:ferredoxin
MPKAPRRHPRARGVIALMEENCTVCMLCARSAPTGASTSRATRRRRRREGGRQAPHRLATLDRFDIDFALCMYCGICVEVCPFDALFWSPEFEYSEPASPTCSTTRPPRRVDGDRPRLRALRGRLRGEGRRCRADGRPEHRLLHHRRGHGPRRHPGGHRPQRRPRRLWLVVVLAGVAAQFILLAAEFIAVTQVLVYIGAIVVLFLFGIMLTRARIGEDQDLTPTHWYAGPSPRCSPVRGDGLRADRRVGLATTELPADTRSRPSTAPTPPQVSDSIFASTWSRSRPSAVLLLAALIGAIVLARKDGGLRWTTCSSTSSCCSAPFLFCIGVYGVLARATPCWCSCRSSSS